MPVTTTSTLAGFPDANSTGVRDGVTFTRSRRHDGDNAGGRHQRP